tara:strand:- start:1967 stop:2182 length:216 start_codon:yes stop_codon:yes gene_type:complete
MTPKFFPLPRVSDLRATRQAVPDVADCSLVSAGVTAQKRISPLMYQAPCNDRFGSGLKLLSSSLPNIPQAI